MNLSSHLSFLCLQSQFLLSLQAISIMVHFYMGTKGPENVSLHTVYFIHVYKDFYLNGTFFYLFLVNEKLYILKVFNEEMVHIIHNLIYITFN